MNGLKENTIRQHDTCNICKKKIGELPLPIFWLMQGKRYVVDTNAVYRQTALAGVLGNARLAQVMGTDADMAKCLEEVPDTMVCDQCMLNKFPELFSVNKESNVDPS